MSDKKAVVVSLGQTLAFQAGKVGILNLNMGWVGNLEASIGFNQFEFFTTTRMLSRTAPSPAKRSHRPDHNPFRSVICLCSTPPSCGLGVVNEERRSALFGGEWGDN